jgi:hypothetical protein
MGAAVEPRIIVYHRGGHQRVKHKYLQTRVRKTDQTLLQSIELLTI